MSNKKIYLIDGNSFIYRMFFAIPEFATKKGKVVNATFGMAKFFVGQLVKEKPDYIVFIKDAKGKNFRHDIYEEYKATRDRMPDTLRSQMVDIESLIQAMEIDIIAIPGYEADDVIATLAVDLSKESNNEIYILSGDKDLYALVDEQVKIYDTQRKKISGPEETFKKFGVPASCVTDYLAICGDSSDNIPGIAGIGPKKAQVLLNEFGTLEKIYEIVDDIENKRENISTESQKIFKGKTLEKFITGKKSAFLSQRLATLACDVDLPDFKLENYTFSPKDIKTPELQDFFERFEFFSLMEKQLIQKETWEKTGKKVQIIGDTQGLIELESQIFSQKNTTLVLDTETTSLNSREAELVGISLLLDENNIFYINILHSGPKIKMKQAQEFVQSLLESNIKIIGHNLKYDLQILEVFLKNDGKKQKKLEKNNFGQMGLGI